MVWVEDRNPPEQRGTGSQGRPAHRRSVVAGPHGIVGATRTRVRAGGARTRIRRAARVVRAATARAAAEGAFERGTLSADLPTVELPRKEVIGAMIAAVTTRAGLTASNGEARRLAQGGGLRLNDTAIADGARLIEASDVNADGVLKLAAGKKKIVLVKPIQF